MYLDHFGLRELPFRLTPDTDYFYKSAGHQEALNVLLLALRSGEGFIKVSGEVGTGKTLLCRLLLKELEGTEFHTAYIPNPLLTQTALVLALADELGLSPPRNQGWYRLLQLINQRLVELTREGRRVVLILDEAQAIPVETLEALRLLSNLETEKSKLLQVVIFGQPELDQILARPAVRQLRQRIAFSYRIPHLDLESARGYVAHRFYVAGARGRLPFGGGAMRDLHRISGGIPRLLNILCHKALMAAYGEGSALVERRHLRAAARDTEDTAERARQWRPRWVWSLVGVAAGFAVGAGAVLAGVLP